MDFIKKIFSKKSEIEKIYVDHDDINKWFDEIISSIYKSVNVTKIFITPVSAREYEVELHNSERFHRKRVWVDGIKEYYESGQRISIDGNIAIKDNKVSFYNLHNFQDVLTFENILTVIKICVSETISEYSELTIKKAQNKETYPQ